MRAMRQVIAPAIMMAAISMVSGCATTSEVVEVAPPKPLPELREAGLKQRWQRDLVLVPGEKVSNAWRVNSSVYVTTSESRLFRIDASTGLLTWTKNFGNAGFGMYCPIELQAGSGPPTEVFVVTLGEVMILNINTGDVKQTSRVPLSVSVLPAVVGNMVCVGGVGRMVGVYLDRLGTRAWTLPLPGDAIEAQPLTLGNSVLFATKNGKLWRVNADSGQFEWKDRQTNGEVVAPLATDGQILFVPSLDRRVYAFDIDSGAELWQSQVEGVLDRRPVVAKDVVLVPATGHGMYALNRQTGEHKWDVPGASVVATIDNDHVWVGNEAGDLRCISLATGDTQTETQLSNVQVFVRNTVDSGVIVVNTTGVVGEYQPSR